MNRTKLNPGLLALAFLVSACTSPPPCVPAVPPATPAPTVQLPTPSSDLASSLVTMLPDSAHIVSYLSADLDGDGIDEWIVLIGFGRVPDRLGYDWLQLVVLKPQLPEGQRTAWLSDPLVGDRGEPLLALDLTGDGNPEVVSVQSMGAAGQTVYVLSSQGSTFGFLRAEGGSFHAQDHFGQNGARLKQVDGDQLPTILASFGPAASWMDTYGWNGSALAHVETLPAVGK